MHRATARPQTLIMEPHEIGWFISHKRKRPNAGVHSTDSVCPNCGKAYTYRKNMMRHLTMECNKKPREKCPYCLYISKYKFNLKNHISRKHKNLPNIQ